MRQESLLFLLKNFEFSLPTLILFTQELAKLLILLLFGLDDKRPLLLPNVKELVFEFSEGVLELLSVHLQLLLPESEGIFGVLESCELVLEVCDVFESLFLIVLPSLQLNKSLQKQEDMLILG